MLNRTSCYIAVFIFSCTFLDFSPRMSTRCSFFDLGIARKRCLRKLHRVIVRNHLNSSISFGRFDFFLKIGREENIMYLVVYQSQRWFPNIQFSIWQLEKRVCYKNMSCSMQNCIHLSPHSFVVPKPNLSGDFSHYSQSIFVFQSFMMTVISSFCILFSISSPSLYHFSSSSSCLSALCAYTVDLSVNSLFADVVLQFCPKLI